MWKVLNKEIEVEPIREIHLRWFEVWIRLWVNLRPAWIWRRVFDNRTGVSSPYLTGKHPLRCWGGEPSCPCDLFETPTVEGYHQPEDERVATRLLHCTLGPCCASSPYSWLVWLPRSLSERWQQQCDHSSPHSVEPLDRSEKPLTGRIALSTRLSWFYGSIELIYKNLTITVRSGPQVTESHDFDLSRLVWRSAAEMRRRILSPYPPTLYTLGYHKPRDQVYGCTLLSSNLTAVLASISAPRFSNRVTVAVWPLWAALCSAVQPF